MIEKMYKLYLLIQNETLDYSLDEIQKLGVVHIKLCKLDPELFQEAFHTERRVRNQKIKNLLRYCEAQGGLTSIVQTALEEKKNVPAILEEFESLLQQIEALNNDKDRVEKDLTQLTPWGRFDKDLIKKLNDGKVQFYYYQVPKGQFAKFKSQGKFDAITHEVILEASGSIYFVTINEKLEIQGLDDIRLPETDMADCEARIETLNKQIEQLHQQARTYYRYKNVFNQHLLKGRNDLELIRAKKTFTNHYESFSSVVAWIPETKFDSFEKNSRHLTGMAYVVEKDLSKENEFEIPIEYKNNKFFKLFEPITKIYATPHYNEFDLTPFFGPFFIFFFGLCMCDFAYGVIVLAILSVVYFKVPKEAKGFVLLGMLMSLGTIFWGLITGVVAGFEMGGHNAAHHPFMSQFVILKAEHIFYLALMLGLLQIFFGMFIKTLSKFYHGGFLKSLSSFGWMILIMAITVLYLQTQAKESEFKLGDMLLKFCHGTPKGYAETVALVGVGLVLFFNDLKSNIFVRVLKGLIHLYEITAFLGDVLSYIRLFALGISAGILGAVLNSIALQLLNIPVPGLSHLLFGVVFVGGHIFLFFLGGLGSFVHPLRLTFVEFYKNAGFSGGGTPYAPLKKVDKN